MLLGVHWRYMKAKNFDPFEAVITFVIYIALQDKKFSDQEKSELFIDIPLIRKFYFDCYGEFIKFDAMTQVKEIEKLVRSKDFLFEDQVGLKEQKFISDILKESQTRTLALLIARHVAESDGFALSEKTKFHHWMNYFSQLEFRI